jgi:hypothetical protein
VDGFEFILDAGIRNRVRGKIWIRIRIKVQNQRALEAQHGAVEGRRRSDEGLETQIGALRACRVD